MKKTGEIMRRGEGPTRREALTAMGWAGPALCGLVAGCVGRAAPGSDALRLGAYSVVREAFHEGLLPAFADEWRRSAGRDVRFEESYNASGAQARSIASGLDVDIAVLSHSGDVARLVETGRARPDWDAGPDQGVITRSLVVIGHRPGNPKGVRDWSDLARPGVGVLYPDPRTSGGARWNINAIYGAALRGAGRSRGDRPDRAAARELLARIQANVVNMGPSGRQSVASFEQGMGDALVTYENELLLRRAMGREIPYVVPPATLLIEGPAALIERSVEKHGNRQLAEAFLKFLHSARGQRILVKYGFRTIGPLGPEIAEDGRPPLPPGLFTMADLGGWAKVQEELYGPSGLWTTTFSTMTKGT